MIYSTGLRGKVERLLKGSVRQIDIHDILFELRGEVAGTGLVDEVANFAAHTIRTQGFVWKDVNDTTSFMRFKYQMETSPIITQSIPANAPEVLRRNLLRARKQTLMKYVGTSKDQALKILDDVIKRSLPGSLGRISKFELRNPLEHRTMTFALSHMKGGSLFTGDDLFEDCCRALVAKNVLFPSEKVELRKIRAALTIVAMTIMHKCKIDLGDGTFAEIAIEQDKKGDLGCSAIAELGKKQGSALIAHF